MFSYVFIHLSIRICWPEPGTRPSQQRISVHVLQMWRVIDRSCWIVQLPFHALIFYLSYVWYAKLIPQEEMEQVWHLSSGPLGKSYIETLDRQNNLQIHWISCLQVFFQDITPVSLSQAVIAQKQASKSNSHAFRSCKDCEATFKYFKKIKIIHKKSITIIAFVGNRIFST